VTRSFALALCCMLSSAAWSARVGAQDKPRSQKSSVHARARPHDKSHAAAKRKAARSVAPPRAAEPSQQPSPKPVRAESGNATPAPNPIADADATENVRKEGDTEIKTVEFGGLDIEGQLKSPQMLYFLNRLRAEFERPQLPHRSFMPELQRSTKENAF
jgi:hypothetical protein